jgi:enoyl-CoA hydratase
VLVGHSDGVTTVTLNRPHILNALDSVMSWRLYDAFRRADAEPTTGSIVLTGAGRAFCAGGDTRNMGIGPPTVPVLHRDWHLHQRIMSTEKPVIAMVRGAAVGLGVTIALACDIVMVADDAKLGDTHVPLGVLAGDGAMVPLVLDAGPLTAKRILLSGDFLSGASAAAAGVVNSAWPADDLADRCYELARHLAAQPQYALRATKLAVNRLLRWAEHELLEPGLAMEMVSMGLPEHPEAVRRFHQRREEPKRKVQEER